MSTCRHPDRTDLNIDIASFIRTFRELLETTPANEELNRELGFWWKILNERASNREVELRGRLEILESLKSRQGYISR